MLIPLSGNGRYKHHTAYLWYLAVDPDLRNAGIGGWLYGEVIKLVHEWGRCDAQVFGVDLPEHCETDEAKLLAERRIGFYRRQGAKLFFGVRYIESVGWQPPVPMGVMFHMFTEFSPEDALNLSEKVLSEKIERVGNVTLE